MGRPSRLNSGVRLVDGDLRYAQMQTDKGREYLGTKRQLALREWFRSVALRDTAPANFLAIGDSITEGKQATTHLTRWSGVLPGLLRTEFPTTGAPGGAGYLEASQSSGFTPAFTGYPVAKTGTVGAGAIDKGLGLESVNFSSTGSLVLSVSNATAVDAIYYKASGTRTIGVQVDAGAVSNVDGGNSASVNDFNTFRVTIPDLGAHTVTITAVAGTIGFDGFYVYNGDEAKGVRVWAGGFSGQPSSRYVTNATFLGHQVARVQPSCVMIELGANDYQNTGPITAAAFKANIQSIIATVRANATRPPSIILAPVWTWTPGVTPVEAGGWAAFVAAMYSIAAADDDICVFDLQQRFHLKTVNDLGRDLLSADNTHPSNAGYWLFAKALAKFLTP
jgi:lysophospholipase L1-like esterase